MSNYIYLLLVKVDIIDISYIKNLIYKLAAPRGYLYLATFFSITIYNYITIYINACSL